VPLEEFTFIPKRSFWPPLKLKSNSKSHYLIFQVLDKAPPFLKLILVVCGVKLQVKNAECELVRLGFIAKV
jgi:hypothetical protein